MGTITTAMCNSFKQELLGGVHDLDTHTLKLALIKPSPTSSFGAATTNYSDLTANSDEASGTNYSAGGQNLDSATISLSGTTAFVDFADEVFSNLTITAAGALIYNSSASNKAIAVFSFGSNVASTAGDFTVIFPAADASNAVLRIT
ncbi:MAG: hypothetical protein CMB98_02115 [Flavobacteriaceae bacterium]|nr:hypothetical protein [Flavobacteriaceae bacterium]|tara:strand:+ start:186 stop:626 length:441 start_codon:yes stop_codon:yes gene_type:complete